MPNEGGMDNQNKPANEWVVAEAAETNRGGQTRSKSESPNTAER